MKIAVFATGWNGEYLRDMYHGLENSLMRCSMWTLTDLLSITERIP